jgi:hypothetical protein
VTRISHSGSFLILLTAGKYIPLEPRRIWKSWFFSRGLQKKQLAPPHFHQILGKYIPFEENYGASI